MRNAFWTFSLRRLLVGVTILCALLALVANFPEPAYAVALAIPFFVPTFVVCAGLTGLSSLPIEAFALTFLGATVGLLLTPGVPAVLSDVYLFNLLSMPWMPALGAFVLGLPWVLFFPRWKNRHG
jgi:hypothetical protein